MARRRYYRSRRTYSKQKWLPVNNEVPVNGNTVTSGSIRILYNTVTQNNTRTGSNGQGNISSASIIKVGRFKYKGLIQTSTLNYPLTYIIGLSYLPEGYDLGSVYSFDNVGECFFYRHPEWLLCWTRLDYNNSTQNNEIRLGSRLKRNLNSGDSIIVFVIAMNYGTQDTGTSNVTGTVSYVCRNN